MDYSVEMPVIKVKCANKYTVFKIRFQSAVR